MKNKLRKLGDITVDMEPLLLELCVDHELQWHEVMGLVHAYLQTHCPDSQEKYVEGGSPVYYYGPKEGIK